VPALHVMPAQLQADQDRQKIGENEGRGQRHDNPLAEAAIVTLVSTPRYNRAAPRPAPRSVAGPP
jgi:hypothetical protein